MKGKFILLFIILYIFLSIIYAVDRGNFRTCSLTSFCRNYRNYKNDGYFSIDTSSIELNPQEGKFSAKISASNNSNPLYISLSFLKSGVVRAKINEKTPRWQPTDLLQPNALESGSFTQIKDSSVLPPDYKNTSPNSFLAFSFSSSPSSSTTHDNILILDLFSFSIKVYHQNILTLSINDRNLLHFQHSLASIAASSNSSYHSEDKNQDRHKGKTVVDYGEDGLAIYSDGTKEEKTEITSTSTTLTQGGDSFKGHHDSQPFGPKSVGLDISFPHSIHVYGIPEHTTSLSLPTTITSTGNTESIYSEPFRLYNLDVFEFEIDEPMALYGNIPLLWAHGVVHEKPLTSGIFWFNPSETFVDISEGKKDNSLYKETHWISESGEIDIFLFSSSSINSLMKQYSTLTGTQQLPPLFSLGYHQCRWNYRDEKDVEDINKKFEQYELPYDVIWLDIEHTKGKRYFTWDEDLFPTPQRMIDHISSYNRKTVTIIDPHIKRDPSYNIHSIALANNYYIRDKTGKKEFEGWCWPGSSSYLDFTSPKVRNWWSNLFLLENYKGSTLDLYTWNDMNEPSVFNGPEVSMPKDTLNLEGIEHREWHNLYGIYMQMATQEGHIVRSIDQMVKNNKNLNYVSPTTSSGSSSNSSSNKNSRQLLTTMPTELYPYSYPLRPFVLTRSFWAGSQRYGAMWIGDSAGEWSHLENLTPILLSLSVSGFSFTGGDVGGFFKNPSQELFTRWFTAGSFHPFFRNHAHHDVMRKEPWVYGEEALKIHKKYLMIRYSLLPLWYSLFFEAYTTGLGVIRPLFWIFPNYSSCFSIDDQFFVGNSLLVKPIVRQNTHQTTILLPPIKDECENNNQEILPWFDFETHSPVYAEASSEFRIQVQTPIAKIPVYIKPGTIFAQKIRYRRTSKAMEADPYTIIVAPGSCNKSEGTLYTDDETTLAYKIGEFSHRRLTFDGVSLTSTPFNSDFTYEIPGEDPIYANPNFTLKNTIERIILLGQEKAPSEVTLVINENQALPLKFSYNNANKSLTIKKPDVHVTSDWKINFKY